MSTTAEEQKEPSSIDLIFSSWDKDKNHQLSKAEFPGRLQSRMGRMDSDGNGSVNKSELAGLPDKVIGRLISMIATPEGEGAGKKTGKSFRKEGEYYAPPAREEFQKEVLKVGDEAPDFTLPRSDGLGEVTLLDVIEKKPVVLIFGSITCGPFRSKVPDAFALEKKYGEKASFFMVYIREAHPESTIYLEEDGVKVLRKFTQTNTLEERTENATSCTALIGTPFPTLIDKEDNVANVAYAGWPNRLVVVGKDGKIAYDGGKGPKGFKPLELDDWLSKNL